MKEQATLSICIPIYNRSFYLERMLSSFLIEKELFEQKIDLFISDNCSEENLYSIVRHYIEEGLNIRYNRNEKNLGMDGNFIKCFQNAKGKYMWLLGSDDTPKVGYLKKLLDILDRCEIGILNICRNRKTEQGLHYVNGAENILLEVGVFITYISGNIVNTKIIKSVNLNKYIDTLFVFVPVTLNAMTIFDKNAVLDEHPFIDGNDSKNNGGYNIFKVFVQNLHKIIYEKILDGTISVKTYCLLKEKIFHEFMEDFIHRLLINKEKNNFILDHSWCYLILFYYKDTYFWKFIIKEYREKLKLKSKLLFLR